MKLVQLQVRSDSSVFLPFVSIEMKRCIARTFPYCVASRELIVLWILSGKLNWQV